MRAILVDEPGEADDLYIGEVDTPTPASNEVLVQVQATSLNRADLLQRKGNYPPPSGASSILGLDVAGTVEAVGADVSRWEVGDRVFGLVPGGGYATYAVIHEDMAMPLPETLSFEQAAAVPEVFLTAYQALHWLGAVGEGDGVLIHAGAGGVGTAATQLAAYFGAHPICTTSSGSKTDVCRACGATTAIDYETQEFSDVIVEEWGENAIDVVLDFIGAPYWDANVEVLSVDGRIVLLSVLGGTTVEKVDLMEILINRVHLIGSTLRSRDRSYKIRLTREFSQGLLPAFEEGSLRPIIDRVFPWDKVTEAHRYMGANKNTGKIVLAISP